MGGRQGGWLAGRVGGWEVAWLPPHMLSPTLAHTTHPQVEEPLVVTLTVARASGGRVVFDTVCRRDAAAAGGGVGSDDSSMSSSSKKPCTSY